MKDLHIIPFTYLPKGENKRTNITYHDSLD